MTPLVAICRNGSIFTSAQPQKSDTTSQRRLNITELKFWRLGNISRDFRHTFSLRIHRHGYLGYELPVKILVSPFDLLSPVSLYGE